MPLVLVKINARLDYARKVLAAQLEQQGKELARNGEPMTPEELARMHYQERLDLDAALRDVSDFWASRSVDEGYVAQTRAVLAGRANNAEINELLGDVLEKYAHRGNLSAPYGSAEWRKSSRAIADAALAALENTLQRDDGVTLREEHHPPHLAPKTVSVEIEPFVEPLSLRGLLDFHLKA